MEGDEYCWVLHMLIILTHSLFWITGKDPESHKPNNNSNYVSSSNTEIISVIEGFSLSILFRLFWSDWETAGIHSVDKETGQDVETVAQGLDRPTQFALFQATPPGLWHPDPLT